MLSAPLKCSRTVARPVAQRVRFLSSLTPSQAAAQPAAQRSLMDSIFNRSSTPAVPLDQVFPGLPELTTVTPTAPEAPQLTTLASGLRVVTTDTASPTASVGVFVDCGSRYEDPSRNGITHFLEHMAFKSTTTVSDFRLVRDMCKIGANVTCSTSREYTVYSADCMNEFLPQVMSSLGDVMQNQAFLPEEIKDAKKVYAAESTERENAADMQIMEAIHSAAYYNNTLGASPYAPDHNLASFTPEALREWTTHLFTPNRTVVSAVGVDHAEFCKLTEESLDKLSPNNDWNAPPAEYTGGDVRIHKANSGDGLTHFALAFETASWHGADLVPMCVLQMMMGGGGSFSAGGPGKGMYSRLYENVLNCHHWVESATSFNSIFADSALFGIYGTTVPESADQLVDALSKQALDMAGKVDDVELSRAKKQLASAVHMQLENRALQVEDIGRQVMMYGKVESAADMCAKIDAVTASDIRRVASDMLKTTPSVAGYGDLSALPRYDSIAKLFG